jgi:hypothetical protein
LNIITTAIMILTLFTAAENAALLPPAAVPWVAIVIAILNIILRVWVTSEPTTKPFGIGDKSDNSTAK